MATSYGELVNNIRLWANKDTNVLMDNIVRQCVQFAADTAYKEMMIPPFENTVSYLILDGTEAVPGNTMTNNFFTARLTNANINTRRSIANVELPIPDDLTTFIHVRIRGFAEMDESNVFTVTANGDLTVDSSNFDSSVVFNEKTDVRTYHDGFADTYSYNFWTRQGSNILVAGDLGRGAVVEVYYYRRLSALDSRYTVSGITNLMDNRLTRVYYDTSGTERSVTEDAPVLSTENRRTIANTSTDTVDISPDPTEITYSTGDSGNLVITWTGNVPELIADTDDGMNPRTQTTVGSYRASFEVSGTNYTADFSSGNVTIDDTANTWTIPSANVELTPVSETELASTGTTERVTGNRVTTITDYYIGRLVPNWLRDENQKVILFGALYHAFDYLQDPQEAQRFLAKFQGEMEQLRKEEMMRKTSGGNIQMHFNGRGLI